VGRYTIFEPFASGGMATVHLALLSGSAGFERVVAVKRMRPELLSDAAFVRMFQDEARLASRIVHPNVVTTLDVVRDERELLLVMEYVRGVALKELLELCREERTPVPVDVALSILGGILEGLHAAHGVRGDDGWLLGVVHRDVSPHNVLLGRDGVPKLVDFGIAKAVSHLAVTGTHEVRGKLGYMAPERVAERTGDLRVDVYSCGVLLWEMLAGRRRYLSATVGDLVEEILGTDPPPLRDERADVPAALDRVIQRATARHPDDRYPTAEAMLSELETTTTFATKRRAAAWLAQMAEPILSKHEELTRAVRAIARETRAEEDTTADGAPSGVLQRTWEVEAAGRGAPGVAGLEELREPTTPLREMDLGPTSAREEVTIRQVPNVPPTPAAGEPPELATRRWVGKAAAPAGHTAPTMVERLTAVGAPTAEVSPTVRMQVETVAMVDPRRAGRDERWPPWTDEASHPTGAPFDRGTSARWLLAGGGLLGLVLLGVFVFLLR
jgi:serine/threonine-protein kinase